MYHRLIGLGCWARNTKLYYMLLDINGGVNVTKPMQIEIISMKNFVLKLLRPHLTTAEFVLFLFCFSCGYLTWGWRMRFIYLLIFFLHPTHVEMTRNVPCYVSGNIEKWLFNWCCQICRLSTSEGRIWL